VSLTGMENVTYLAAAFNAPVCYIRNNVIIINTIQDLESLGLDVLPDMNVS